MFTKQEITIIDPITLSTSFATIVGLLTAYKGERDKHKEQNCEDFKSWLSEKQHQAVIDALKQNNNLQQGIEQLLSQNHEQVMEKLENLEKQISFIATQNPDFSTIAKAIDNEAGLSKQAISMISQLVQSGADYCFEHKLFTGKPNEFLFLSKPGKIQISEPRFVNEDWEQLENFNLVRIERKKTLNFYPTRQAYKYYSSQIRRSARNPKNV